MTKQEAIIGAIEKITTQSKMVIETDDGTYIEYKFIKEPSEALEMLKKEGIIEPVKSGKYKNKFKITTERMKFCKKSQAENIEEIILEETETNNEE